MDAKTRNLIRALETGDEGKRLYAAQDLQELGNPDIAPLLARRIRDEPSRAVRDALFFALRSLETPEVYEILYSYLSLPEAELRNGALTVFGAYGENALHFLGEKYGTASADVRKSILDSAFLMKNQSGRSLIRRGLEDPELNIRIAAVEYAPDPPDPETVSKILAFADHAEEPMLRSAVYSALLKMDSSGFDTAGTVWQAYARMKKNTNETSLYLPQFISAAGRKASVEDFIHLMHGIPDKTLYSEEIIEAVTHLMYRNPEIAGNAEICGILTELTRQETSPEDRMNAASLLVEFSSEEAEQCLMRIVEMSGDKALSKFILERLGKAAGSE